MATNKVDEVRYARQMGFPIINLAGGLKNLHGI